MDSDEEYNVSSQDTESPDSDVSSRTRSRGIASTSRGRGRGRGQTRGRGSTPRVRGGAGRSGTPRVRGGQGRGSTPRVRGQAGRGRGSAENDRLVDLQEQRRQSMRSAIEELTHEQCKELLFEAASKQPALLMDFFHAADGHYSPPRPPAPSGNAPIWCTCSHCREMPTDLERLCCGKIPERCLAMKPEMETRVLDPTIIHLIMQLRGEYMAVPYAGDNRCMRHGAYTAYILYMFHQLGRGNRRVIPSCVTWKIRDRFPEPTGQYTGFVPVQ